MIEPKLLSPAELNTELAWFASNGVNGQHGKRLLAHIAALEADNAVLMRALEANAPDCLALAVEHPGTTLLAEHAKELARARNEGLERAANRLAGAPVLETHRDTVKAIRAMREPEQ